LVCATFSTDQSNLTRTFFPNSLSNGLEKIRYALVTVGLLRTAKDSLLITITTIIGMLFICSLASYEFAFYKFPLKKILFATVMSSMMLPMVLYVVPLYRFVVNIGFSDTVLGVAFPLMISPLSIFIMMQFLEDMPLSLVESARVDGCGHFRTFFNIILPLMQNAVITTTVLMFLSVWGAYMWPSLVAGEKLRPMSIAIVNLLNPNFYTDPRVKIAAMLFSSLPPLGIYFIFQRYIIHGIATQGIKG
jgi:multiple sugar transport system permease protein